MKILRVKDKSSWRSVAVTGVLIVIAGLSLLIWPFFTASWILALLFGIALIAAGISVSTHVDAKPGTVIFGIILAIAGVLAFLFSQSAANFLVVILGSILIGVGVLWFLLTLVFARVGSPVLLLAPALTIVAGIIPMFAPKFALTMLATFAGAIITVWGVTLLISAFKIRDAKPMNMTADITVDYDPKKFGN